MKCEECLPLIEEYVDGELDGRTAGRVEAHLSACAACADELAALSREQELYANYRRDLEVTPAAWNIIRARIEQERDAARRQESRPSWRDWIGGLFTPARRLRPAAVAALTLVVIGIAAGILYLNSRRMEVAVQPIRQNATPAGDRAEESLPPSNGSKNGETASGAGLPQKNNPARPRSIVAGNAGTPRTMREGTKLELDPYELVRVTPGIFGAGGTAARDSNNDSPGARLNRPVAAGDFDSEIARHAGRAELLLRSFRNVRPVTAAARALDVSFEKEQARRLLYRNIALRRAAAERGDPAASGLLNTLEPILLDIANLPGRVRARDVQSIERRMEKKEIVAALQVRTLLASN